MPTDYSGTPLVKKLGYKPGQAAWFDAMPGNIRAEIGESGVIGQADGAGAEAAHLFVTQRADLAAKLASLRHAIARDGFRVDIVAEKASKVPTDITEDVIRTVALPMGWVDVKVCAVDEIWSGLKLVIRKELR